MESQEWAVKRFAGLRPDNIGGSYRIASLGGLEAPPGFAPVWRLAPAKAEGAKFGGLLAENVSDMDAVLLMFHPGKRDEIAQACHLMQALEDTFRDRTPPLFCVYHTVAPEDHPASIAHNPTIKDFAIASMEAGFEDVIMDEVSGFRLALKIRLAICKTRQMAETMTCLLERRRWMRQRRTELQERIHSVWWEYLAVKLGGGSVPRLDRTISPAIPSELHGWTVSMQMGTGPFGSTYLLTQPPTPEHPEGSKMVLKAMVKSQYKTVSDLHCLKRSIDSMQRVSSDEGQHPRITKLVQVYHSSSHILMCLEYGGSTNLFRRLRQRDTSAGQNERLPPGKVRAIIEQCVEAVAHIHTVPGICHRNIKPENFDLHEEPNGPQLLLKLTDFDLAANMRSPCRTACGSMPFVAPEVVLAREYKGGPADIWSLSVVMLEVLCHTRLLEAALPLDITPQGGGNPPTVAADLTRHFSAQGSVPRLVEEHLRPELTQLLPVVKPVLQRTLHVDPGRRWDATRLRAALGRM